MLRRTALLLLLCIKCCNPPPPPRITSSPPKPQERPNVGVALLGVARVLGLETDAPSALRWLETSNKSIFARATFPHLYLTLYHLFPLTPPPPKNETSSAAAAVRPLARTQQTHTHTAHAIHTRSSERYGLMSSAYSCSQIVGGLVLGALSDHAMSRRNVLIISFLGSALSYGTIGLSSSLNMLLAGRVIVGLVKQVSARARYLFSLQTPGSFGIVAAQGSRHVLKYDIA